MDKNTGSKLSQGYDTSSEFGVILPFGLQPVRIRQHSCRPNKERTDAGGKLDDHIIICSVGIVTYRFEGYQSNVGCRIRC